MLNSFPELSRAVGDQAEDLRRALRESEEKFRSLADIAPCGIFIHDQHRLLYANRATCDITGYSLDELLRLSLFDLVHPDSFASIQERFRLRSEGKPVPSRSESKIITKSGVSKWICFSGAEIDFAGKRAVISGAIDVTEQKHADELLRVNQERVRVASESAGVGTWEWDIPRHQVLWSAEVYRIFGLPEDDSSSGSFELLLNRIHADDRQLIRARLEDAVSNHLDFSAEFRIDNGAGKWSHAYVRAKTFYDAAGQPERMVGVAIDMTGSKITEHALRESEARFRAAFNQAAVGMSQLGLDGTLVMVNQKLCDILGYSEEELLGHKIRDFTHPDDISHELDLLRATMEGEIASYTLVKRYIRKDGFARWVRINASLVRDESGHPSYLIKVIDDVTERLQAAEALRRTEKLAATGRLAASIAHEINNPLEAVTNLLYLLEHNKSLDATARGYARMAQEEVSRVAHIARQTLGFYRDSTKIESVSINAMMDDVLNLFSRKLRNAEIEVVTDYRSNIPVESYPGELRQVLSNLLANAIDAIGKKGRIKIRTTDTYSHSGGRKPGVRLTLADTGKGVASELKQNLFEPFFTTKGAKGTGLGLWVTRGMVEKHAGSIRLFSSTRPGRSGTAFSIFLPRKQKAEAIRKRTSR